MNKVNAWSQKKENRRILVTEDTYRQEVLASDLPVLVEFYASWCGKCAMMQETVAQLAEEYQGIIKVCQIDIDKSEVLAAQFEVTEVPTFVIFVEGEPVAAASGVVRKSMLKKMIEDFK